ncbi:transposase/IS protein [Pirellulimonas nuda]|uniref:Transposase/IS protein n=1 Tax=Pirellulimonas nuda TaxID=2528009 RepID=A0A518DIZ7_9BACT|nr:ATP-binding protein [Pirellulimonas nuda]QDU91454.1 transposase/IS protein [Pirellulimonas nuda]
MNETLSTTLRRLRLSGLAETLELRLQEASGNGLTHVEFLELILQDEMLIRGQRQIARRVKAASFRELKVLTDFDWSFNTSIKRNVVYDLSTGRFLNDHRDVLLCGPPGTMT